jgi:hypothetical protein
VETNEEISIEFKLEEAMEELASASAEESKPTTIQNSFKLPLRIKRY